MVTNTDDTSASAQDAGHPPPHALARLPCPVVPTADASHPSGSHPMQVVQVNSPNHPALKDGHPLAVWIATVPLSYAIPTDTEVYQLHQRLKADYPDQNVPEYTPCATEGDPVVTGWFNVVCKKRDRDENKCFYIIHWKFSTKKGQANFSPDLPLGKLSPPPMLSMCAPSNLLHAFTDLLQEISKSKHITDKLGIRPNDLRWSHSLCMSITGKSKVSKARLTLVIPSHSHPLHFHSHHLALTSFRHTPPRTISH